MFLDDKLLEICRSADCDTEDDIQKLNEKLCRECEWYYKSNISPMMPRKDAKAVLDRTFNLWNSFVRMALKEEGRMNILGKLFQKYNFKKQLLSNEEMNRLYNSL